MVKAHRTISVDAIILQNAINLHLDINSICETALELASKSKTGESTQVLTDLLKEESEYNKNKQVLRRLYSQRGKTIIADTRFNIALKTFCQAYRIDINNGILIAEGKKEKVAQKENGEQ